MWHFVKWFFSLLLVVFVALLSIANGQFVEINYFLGKVELPLCAALFFAMISGVLLCAIWMLPRYYCVKWANKNANTSEHD